MFATIAVPLLVIGGTLALAWRFGRYMKWAMDPEPSQAGGTLGSLLGRAGFKAGAEEQTWKQYCVSMLAFNVLTFAIVYCILELQGWLPFNPDGKTAIEPSLAFNTSASFASNTNLQHYSGEVSMGDFSQIFGLMWLQFVSAATGIAALTALCRGLAGRKFLGNS